MVDIALFDTEKVLEEVVMQESVNKEISSSVFILKIRGCLTKLFYESNRMRRSVGWKGNGSIEEGKREGRDGGEIGALLLLLRSFSLTSSRFSAPLWNRFHFNFADWWQGKERFGCLRVLNDDLVKPLAGFGSHSHRDAGKNLSQQAVAMHDSRRYCTISYSTTCLYCIFRKFWYHWAFLKQQLST